MTTIRPQSKNAERLKKYRAKMDAAGFKRLSFYVSAEMAQFLNDAHEMGECRGRTLERLLLGEAAQRPEYWTREERRERFTKNQAFRQQAEPAQR